MATSSAKPSILLVQGSFQLPEVYGKLVSALEAQGYQVAYPPLPSLTDPDMPDFTSKTLADDAAAVQLELRRLVEGDGRDVLVAMHSYGGLVGSEAIPQELTLAKRKDKGLPGGVMHLFYFAAIIIPAGQSVLSAFGDSDSSEVKLDGRFRIKDAARRLYHNLPPKEAEYWASKIIDQSYAVKTTKLSQSPYHHVPSTYVVCENDQAVPAQLQEMFGKSANANMIGIKSGHSPMLSHTDELVGLISATAGGTASMGA
jgi:pimeloyl-ACP methyl ester carboxylesterase